MESKLLAEIEQTAVDLARLAGAEIAAAVNRTFAIQYKTEPQPEAAPTNPVSEIDYHVENLVREHLAGRFPTHGIIGEEVDLYPESEPEFIWVLDPVDGTNNFINRFPLFAAAIGVLRHGYPIAGAIWCSTSHALRSGVYHASQGGALRFEGEEVGGWNPNVQRRLAGDPGGSAKRTAWWDNRVTGSAAIECAFVAAGILSSTRFYRPLIWDVAGGIVLVRAAGGEVWTREGKKWIPLERFVPPAKVTERRRPNLRDWSQPLILGNPEAVAIRHRQDI